MNDWQRADQRSGIVQPWYTHGALDEIQTWDLSDKVILEYGGGLSTRWWASRAKHVHTVEVDRHWYQKISTFELPNLSLHLRDMYPISSYIHVPDGCEPNVVVVDGEHRRECLEVVLALPRPLVLVFDNWQQDFVFVDDAAEDMMRPYSGRFYIQPDHKNHCGKPWQTAIWNLEART